MPEKQGVLYAIASWDNPFARQIIHLFFTHGNSSVNFFTLYCKISLFFVSVSARILTVYVNNTGRFFILFPYFG